MKSGPSYIGNSDTMTIKDKVYDDPNQHNQKGKMSRPLTLDQALHSFIGVQYKKIVD